MIENHIDIKGRNLLLSLHGPLFQLIAKDLSYAPSHRQDSAYHSLCFTSCRALAGTRKSSMGTP